MPLVIYQALDKWLINWTQKQLKVFWVCFYFTDFFFKLSDHESLSQSFAYNQENLKFKYQRIDLAYFLTFFNFGSRNMM